MRIAMISERLDDAVVDGGVQAVTKYLLSALSDRTDIEVHLLSFDYSANTARKSHGPGYTQHLIPGSRLGVFNGYAVHQRRLDRYLKALKPDIVHAQGAGHFGILAARCNFPSIMTIHGIMSEEAKFISDPRQKFRRWAVATASEFLCIRQARNTILINPYVGTYYGGRLTGRRFDIPNPVSGKFFELARREEPGRILFAGRLYPLKGVSDLIEAVYAVSKQQEVLLILAGALHDTKYVAELRKRVANLGMRKIVKFCGALPESDLLREFERASVMVLPSYQESAPMVIQEAMACGIPVIASAVGGIPYQIERNKTGFLIDAGDIAALTDCLSMLLVDEERRKLISAASREFARNHFHADIVVRKTLAAYQEVLNR